MFPALKTPQKNWPSTPKASTSTPLSQSQDLPPNKQQINNFRTPLTASTPLPSTQTQIQTLQFQPSASKFVGITPQRATFSNSVERIDDLILKQESQLPSAIGSFLQSSRDSQFSCIVDPSGWACYVSNASALVWRWKNRTIEREMNEESISKEIEIYELPLPSSRSLPVTGAHLVHFTRSKSDKGSTRGLLVLTRDGSVRYWPEVQSKKRIDASLTLELTSSVSCVSKIENENEFIVGIGSSASSTAKNLFSILIESETMSIQSFESSKPSSGMGFFGLGSVFSWGGNSNTSQVSDQERNNAILSIVSDSESTYCLSRSHLQQWILSEKPYKSLEIDILSELKEQLQNGNLKQAFGFEDAASVFPHLVELQLIRYGERHGNLAVLFALTLGQRIEHGLLLISVSSDSLEIRSQVALRAEIAWKDIASRFFVGKSYIYLVGPSQIVVFNANILKQTDQTTQHAPRLIPKRVMGASQFVSGLLFVSTVSVESLSPINEKSQPKPEMIEEEIMQVDVKTDRVSDFVRPVFEAFSSLEQDPTRSRAVLQKLQQTNEQMFFDSIVTIATELANSLPIDETWAERKNHANEPYATKFASIQLKKQLEEKQERLRAFFAFVQSYLTNMPKPSFFYLYSLVQKVSACIALQAKQQLIETDRSILNDALKTVVSKNRHVDFAKIGITIYEAFFSKITHINELLVVLRDTFEIRKLSDGRHDLIQDLIDVNEIYFAFVSQYDNVTIHLQAEFETEPAFKSLEQQIFIASPLTISNVNTKQGNKDQTEQQAIHQKLIAQLRDLSERYLDAYVVGTPSKSIEDDIACAVTRNFKTFAPDKGRELAAKFQQMTTLAQYTYELNGNENEKKRENLKRTYLATNELFATTFFENYVMHSRLYDLVKLGEEYPQALAQYMSTHPNKKIDWLHYLFIGNFVQAASMLYSLAIETTSLQKRKTIMSLAKLSCAAATNQQAEIHAMEDRAEQVLKLIEIQEQRKIYVNEDRALSPIDLINFFLTTLHQESDAYSRIQRGKDVLATWKRCDLLLENPTAVLESIWSSIFRLTDWVLWTNQFQQRTQTDIEESIHKTPFFELAADKSHFSLPDEMRTRILEKFLQEQTQRPQTNQTVLARMLNTLVEFIIQARRDFQ